jgi:hypothetical protein
LIGRDITDDSVVIIENQLAQSDHTHLGQIITYAAGTSPTTIVWVAESFRAEHRAAIDWLNARTDEQTRFFGVEIGVVRIGDSDPAPNFRLVAQPNDWEKVVRTASSPTGGKVSERQAAYLDFWDRFRIRVLDKHSDWTRATKSTYSSWFGMSAGVPNVNWLAYFVGGQVTVQVEFVDSDPEVNVARLEALRQHRTQIEAAFGEPLSWERRDGQKGARLAYYGASADILDRDGWDTWIQWYIWNVFALQLTMSVDFRLPEVGLHAAVFTQMPHGAGRVSTTGVRRLACQCERQSTIGGDRGDAIAAVSVNSGAPYLEGHR